MEIIRSVSVSHVHVYSMLTFRRASRRLMAETLHRRITQSIRAEILHHGSISRDPRPERDPQAAGVGREIEDSSVSRRDSRSVTLSTRNSSTPRKPRNASAYVRHSVHRLRLSTWWSTTVWELCSAPQPGWNYGLRIYNIVPEDSAIMRAIMEDDTNAVVELFRSKKASPFDRDQWNDSLLYVRLLRLNEDTHLWCTAHNPIYAAIHRTLLNLD